MGLLDGLPSLQILTAQESGTTVQATSGTFGNVSATNLTVTSLTATNIQSGRVSGAGIANAVVVSFASAFAAAPNVVMCPIGSVASNFWYLAGTSAGSFVFNATGSNTSYDWIAKA